MLPTLSVLRHGTTAVQMPTGALMPKAHTMRPLRRRLYRRSVVGSKSLLRPRYRSLL